VCGRRVCDLTDSSPGEFFNGRTRITEVVDIMDAKDMGAGTVNYKVTH
jgi:hypothetical protein